MNTFLTKIYAYKFFEDFVLIYPLYAVMFTEHEVQAWQLGTLLSIWSLTTFVLEVPSGALADKYSRKHLLFFGQLIRGLGYGCWLIFPNFWGFLAGFICWGIESAFSSGTFEALVYDELKLLGREAEYTRVIGRTRTFGFVAILAASLLASPAILLGYAPLLLMSSASVLLAGLIILTLPRAQAVESTGERQYFQILRAGVGEALQNRSILHLIIFLGLATALPGALDEYWSIFADQAGLPHYGLGLFLGLLSGAEAVGSLFAHHFERWSSRTFYLLFFLNGLILLLAGYIFSVPALLLLVFFSFSFTCMQIVFEGRLQHAILSDTRATISSVNGFLTETGALGVFFSFGLIAQESSYRQGFMFFGGLVAVVGLFYLLQNNKRRDS